MTRHIDTLGFVFMGFGLFQSVIALLIGGFYLLIGLGVLGIGVAEGDGEAIIMSVLSGSVGLCIAAAVLCTAVPSILVGRGLRARRPWSRIGGIILGIMGMFNIPLGTALGVFALVVLFDKEVSAEFDAQLAV